MEVQVLLIVSTAATAPVPTTFSQEQ